MRKAILTIPRPIQKRSRVGRGRIGFESRSPDVAKPRLGKEVRSRYDMTRREKTTSVVPYSNLIIKNGAMDFRGHGMSNVSVRISTVVLLLVTLLTVCYSGFLVLGLDWNILLVKIKSMLLGRSFHFLFSRLGWCCGDFLLAAIFLWDPELGKMMVPSGASGAASSSSSPLPSISTGDSWIEETFGNQGEASSSVPNQGQQLQGGEAPGQPIPPVHLTALGGDQPPLVVEQPGPADQPIDEVRGRLGDAATPSMAISQSSYEEVRQLITNHENIADRLQELFRELRTHVPGGFQAERLAEMLEEEHGGEKMGEILRSLQAEGHQSPYFRDVQTYFRDFRHSGVTEK